MYPLQEKSWFLQISTYLLSIWFHHRQSIKAKVINIQPEANVNMPGGVLKKVEALLIDPHGLFKIVLWEEDIKKVKEGGTYEFRNLRVKRNKFNNEVYVNPAKHHSDITECDAFEEVLVASENIPDEFQVCDIKGEVVGISDTQLQFWCVKCNRRIKSQQTQLIVICGDPPSPPPPPPPTLNFYLAFLVTSLFGMSTQFLII